MKGPFESYPGSKNGDGTFHTIINRIPAHRYYLEGCLGGGAIFRKKRLAEKSILLDASPRVVAKWDEWLKEQANETPAFESCEVQVFDIVVFLMGILKYQWLPNIYEVFVYIDPPYPMISRSGKVLYDEFEWDEKKHKKLLSILTSEEVKFRWMLSTYPNPWYGQALKGYHSHTFEAMTRGGKRIEQIYMNYDPERTPLHDYRYFGENFHRRDKFKVKRRRNLARFEKLPFHQRFALLQELQQRFPTCFTQKAKQDRPS